MGRTAGRSPEQTRRLILEAASTVVRERGSGATLDDIAEAAEVSKGGLLYHFGSKDKLLLAIADAQLDSFRTAVFAALDPSDDSPGRLTRAYVHVSFDPDIDDRAIRDNLVLLVQLTNHDEVASLAAEDNRRWADDLADDGLPVEIQQLVIAAADGAGMAAVWGGSIDRPALTHLRDRLINLTRDQAMWKALGESSAPTSAR